MHGERSCIANPDRFELIQHALSPSKGLVKNICNFIQNSLTARGEVLMIFYTCFIQFEKQAVEQKIISKYLVTIASFFGAKPNSNKIS